MRSFFVFLLLSVAACSSSDSASPVAGFAISDAALSDSSLELGGTAFILVTVTNVSGDSLVLGSAANCLLGWELLDASKRHIGGPFCGSVTGPGPRMFGPQDTLRLVQDIHAFTTLTVGDYFIRGLVPGTNNSLKTPYLPLRVDSASSP